MALAPKPRYVLYTSVASKQLIKLSTTTILKTILTVLTLFVLFQTQGQITKRRNLIWVLPSVDTKINGIAGGLALTSFKDNDSQPTTIVNGLSVELIGLGLLVPLAPSHPFYGENDKLLANETHLDSTIATYSREKYRVNGISISSGGVAGNDIAVNGLNISGLNTLTAKTNGLSICVFANFSAILNGVSIAGLYNSSLQTKGLQVGLFNTTKRLRGFQIGLWNKNEKRQAPFINWNFN
jgi:hypothetical protein